MLKKAFPFRQAHDLCGRSRDDCRVATGDAGSRQTAGPVRLLLDLPFPVRDPVEPSGSICRSAIPRAPIRLCLKTL